MLGETPAVLEAVCRPGEDGRPRQSLDHTAPFHRSSKGRGSGRPRRRRACRCAPTPTAWLVNSKIRATCRCRPRTDPSSSRDSAGALRLDLAGHAGGERERSAVSPAGSAV